MTRCGQGPCQGRVCERMIAERLRDARALQRAGAREADSARRPDGRRYGFVVDSVNVSVFV